MTAIGENCPDIKRIHECFISAVLGSMVCFFLCRDHGFIPLNAARTLIIAASKPPLPQFSINDRAEGENAITLATLDVV